MVGLLSTVAVLVAGTWGLITWTNSQRPQPAPRPVVASPARTPTTRAAAPTPSRAETVPAALIEARSVAGDLRALEQPSRLEAALRVLEQAGEISQRDRTLLVHLLQQKGDLAGAEERLQRLRREDPGNRQVGLLSVAQWFAQEQPLEGAEALLSLRRRDPGTSDIEAYAALAAEGASALLATRRLDEALELCVPEAAERHAGLALVRLQALIAADRFDEAKQWKEGKLDLSEARSYLWDAIIAQHQQRPEQVQAALAQALTVATQQRNHEDLTVLARYASAQRQWPLAADAWEAVIVALPKPPPPLLAAAAPTLLRAHRTAAAARVYGALHQAQPRNRAALIQYAYLSGVLNQDLIPARTAVEAALTSYPNGPALRTTAAFLRWRHGDLPGALALVTADGPWPQSPSAQLTRALVLHDHGQVQEARQLAGALETAALLPEERDLWQSLVGSEP